MLQMYLSVVVQVHIQFQPHIPNVVSYQWKIIALVLEC
jgi:hypothetical protein